MIVRQVYTHTNSIYAKHSCCYKSVKGSSKDESPLGRYQKLKNKTKYPVVWSINASCICRRVVVKVVVKTENCHTEIDAKQV